MTSVDESPPSSQSTEDLSSPTSRVQPTSIIGMENPLENVIQFITPQGMPLTMATPVSASTGGGSGSSNMMGLQTITLGPGNFAVPVAAQQLVSFSKILIMEPLIIVHCKQW